MRKETNEAYILLAVVLGIYLVINFLVMFIAPPLIIGEVLAGVGEYFAIKRIKEVEKNNQKIEDKGNNLLSLGYKKLCTGVYINEDNQKVNLVGKDYLFSQIVDCELVEKHNSINNTFGNTNGKLKNNGKIKAKTNSFSTEIVYCLEMYLKVTINDITNPLIKIDVRENGMLTLESEKYKRNKEEAERATTALKLISAKEK